MKRDELIHYVRAAKQVRDYALVLDKVLPEAARLGGAVFSLELIRNLHAAIVGSDPDYKDVSGALRDAVVWIGGKGNIAYSTWFASNRAACRAISTLAALI